METNRIIKILRILLIVLFLVSLTLSTVSAVSDVSTWDPSNRLEYDSTIQTFNEETATSMPSRSCSTIYRLDNDCLFVYSDYEFPIMTITAIPTDEEMM